VYWAYRAVHGIDGTSYCPECHRQLGRGEVAEAYCRSCAAPLRESWPESYQAVQDIHGQHYCPVCVRPLDRSDAEAGSCSNCGVPLQAPGDYEDKRVVDESQYDELRDYLGKPADDEGRPFHRDDDPEGLHDVDDDSDYDYGPLPDYAEVRRSSHMDDRQWMRDYLARPAPSFSRSLDGGGRPWSERVADAEMLVEQTDADLRDAEAAEGYAERTIQAEHLRERSLSPEDRHRFTELIASWGRVQSARQAYERACAQRDRLLDQAPPSIGEWQGGSGRAHRGDAGLSSYYGGEW
jgi:hypothetical protein